MFSYIKINVSFSFFIENRFISHKNTFQPKFPLLLAPLPPLSPRPTPTFFRLQKRAGLQDMTATQGKKDIIKQGESPHSKGGQGNLKEGRESQEQTKIQRSLSRTLS